MPNNCDLNLSISVDSKEIIYRCGIQGPQSLAYDYAHEFKLLEERIINRKVAAGLELGLKDFDFVSEPSILKLESLLYALRVEIRNYQGATICALQTLPEIDPSQLICRCAYVDKKMLIGEFEKHFGQFRPAVLETQVAQMCSSCLSDVKEIHAGLNFEKISEVELKLLEFVQKELDEFSLYAPQEYACMNYQVTHFKNQTIKIKVLNKNEDLNRQDIHKTLSNYLSKVLKSHYKISVFF